ncbi:histidine phosphatase family protein [Bradyrhizobium sp. sBnM-33]|uniref:histidine phosphatase family protein n=1 Tax=Bradyrhizobium sp. sBnM-33 TaxID=2831780 RepID=UPI0024BDAF9C|nr:histidine phosphatase family protein [Bradyrhizobium sp. sBnM-33]
MTKFSLIRHGVHDVVDHILVGRMAGVRLNSRGRDQARRIADIFGSSDIRSVHSSPQTRALETAEPLAQRLGLTVQIFAGIDELDAGAWTGRSFASLRNDPLWGQWNTERGRVRPPDGESMLELQVRAVDHLNNIAASLPDGHIALCSHAEVIRAVVLHALNLPLDDYHRLDIAPATISTISIDRGGTEVISLNQPVVS